MYDGDNYYIKNINIDSPCYNVGVFGTTAGAEIRNIVLYSDNGGTIERSTPAGTDYRNYRCAYALGGLVGIAYDYLYDANGNGSMLKTALRRSPTAPLRAIPSRITAPTRSSSARRWWAD